MLFKFTKLIVFGIFAAISFYHSYNLKKTLYYAQDLIVMFLLFLSICLTLIRKVKYWILRGVITFILLFLMLNKYAFLEWSTLSLVAVVLMF